MERFSLLANSNTTVTDDTAQIKGEKNVEKLDHSCFLLEKQRREEKMWFANGCSALFFPFSFSFFPVSFPFLFHCFCHFFLSSSLQVSLRFRRYSRFLCILRFSFVSSRPSCNLEPHFRIFSSLKFRLQCESVLNNREISCRW